MYKVYYQFLKYDEQMNDKNLDLSKIFNNL